MHTQWLPVLAALAAFAAPSRSAQDSAEKVVPEKEDPRITRTKERYGFAKWPESVRRWDGVPLAKLAFEGYGEPEIDFTPGLPVTLHYSDPEGTPRFFVELGVHGTVASAREKLVEALTFVSSPRPVPRASRAGIEAGDIGFVGFAPRDRISWIAFVRGNVAVRVASYDPRVTPQPDLGKIAEWTDRLVSARPTMEEDAPLSQPTVARLHPESSRCRAGEAVALDLDVDDVAAMRWVVGGPGQGYVERDEDGRWLLYTTGAGEIELTCHVLGTNGVAAARSTTIQVREED